MYSFLVLAFVSVFGWVCCCNCDKVGENKSC